MCTVDTFDVARKAHGTDHDILFVYSESSPDDFHHLAELTTDDSAVT